MEENSKKVIQNGLSDLLGLLAAQTSLTGTQMISQSYTLYDNMRWYLVSNDRQLISQAYVEHGIIQTLVDQPIDDAFRTGFDIKTEQLSPDQINDIEQYLKNHRVIETLKQACKWSRLYGGGGVLLVTSQDPRTPFKMESLTKYTQLEFKAVDMWELLFGYRDTLQREAQITKPDPNNAYYNYYGQEVHKSRVYRIVGKEAPALIRPRLYGWGMSELERLIRSLNQYLKNQDLIFELLDEAKVDVFKIKGFNTALLNSSGTNAVANRVQLANELKNFQSALTMDADDEYEQKQITFTGLAEMMIQIRQGIAADLKMPVTKLFGISAAGFNSGEDDIENYNAMIESEVRSKVNYIVCDLIKICCQHLFAYIPDDLEIEFKPLRVLSAKDEEEVKERQFRRVHDSYTTGLIPAVEAKQSINQGNLLPIKIDDSLEGLPPVGSNVDATDQNDE